MTQRPCLSSEELAGFIHGSGSEDDSRHVARCEACTRRISFLRRIVSAGADPIADIAAEVDELVTELLAAPRSTWWKRVLEPEYRRQDVARRLLSLSFDARLRDPSMALDLAKAATTIADRLSGVSEQVPDLQFEAWKVTASLMRETARYAETGVALVRAEDAARATSFPELAMATVLFSRALLNSEPDVWRPEEAASLLDRAEEVFALRDPSRLHAVRHARALLLFRSGDLHAARAEFAALLDTTSKADHESYLNALSNLMWVRVELREADPEVEQTIHFLIDENFALRRTEVVARAHWMMGRINMARGFFDRAVELYRRARGEIADSATSIRIGLDMAEALLLDDRHSEALQLARELASIAVTLDEREPSRRHALTAQVLSYLREAAQSEAWSADLVADLARYVDRITRQRPFDFVPPMPLEDVN